MNRFQTTILLLISVAVLYFAKEVLIPLALAGVICMLLTGPVKRLEKLKVPRAIAVTLSVVVTFGLIGLIGWIVGVQFFALAEELPRYQQEIVAKVRAIRGSGGENKLEKAKKLVEDAVIAPAPPPPASKPATSPATHPAATQPGDPTTTTTATTTPGPTETLIKSMTPPSVQGATLDPHTGAIEQAERPDGTMARPFFTIPKDQKSAFAQLWSYVGLALGPLGTAGIVIVFVIFILLEREDLRDRMIRLVSHGRYTVTTTAFDDGITRVLKYLRAQAIVNGTYGLAVALGLWTIGLTVGGGTTFPSFLLWGLLACVLRFVPYIGPWVAAAFPLVLALIVYHGFGVFFAVLILFVVIELISNNIMEPILYGSTTGLSTMAILVSAVFWTWLWGPIGLLLATPLTVVMMVVGRYAPPLRFLEVLLGDRPAMTRPERVYQRLLAGDEDEAYDVAEVCLKEGGLLVAFDEVVLPALAMGENDTAEGLLSDDREHDFRSGMRRLIDALGAEAARDLAEAAGAAVEALRDPTRDPTAATTATTTTMTTTTSPARSGNGSSVPAPQPAISGNAVRVAILPAHDEADELAGLMLAHLLTRDGYHVTNVSHNALASEMVELVEQFDPHALLISATPPAAVSHVRYLLRRLSEKIPVDRTTVGVWSVRTDAQTLRRRLDLKTMTLSVTLKEAVENVRRLTEGVRHVAIGAAT